MKPISVTDKNMYLCKKQCYDHNIESSFSIQSILLYSDPKCNQESKNSRANVH